MAGNRQTLADIVNESPWELARRLLDSHSVAVEALRCLDAEHLRLFGHSRKRPPPNVEIDSFRQGVTTIAKAWALAAEHDELLASVHNPTTPRNDAEAREQANSEAFAAVFGPDVPGLLGLSLTFGGHRDQLAHIFQDLSICERLEMDQLSLVRQRLVERLQDLEFRVRVREGREQACYDRWNMSRSTETSNDDVWLSGIKVNGNKVSREGDRYKHATVTLTTAQLETFLSLYTAGSMGLTKSEFESQIPGTNSMRSTRLNDLRNALIALDITVPNHEYRLADRQSANPDTPSER